MFTIGMVRDSEGLATKIVEIGVDVCPVANVYEFRAETWRCPGTDVLRHQDTPKNVEELISAGLALRYGLISEDQIPDPQWCYKRLATEAEVEEFFNFLVGEYETFRSGRIYYGIKEVGDSLKLKGNAIVSYLLEKGLAQSYAFNPEKDKVSVWVENPETLTFKGVEVPTVTRVEFNLEVKIECWGNELTEEDLDSLEISREAKNFWNLERVEMFMSFMKEWDETRSFEYRQQREEEEKARAAAWVDENIK